MSVFKNKSFLSLVIIRLLINMADSLFYIVTLWYVSSKSPLLTGVAVFCFTLPENFNFIVGPFIDHFNAKKILLFANIGQVILTVILVLLLHLNLMNIYLLFFIILLSTFLSSITYPIEETMIPNLVKNKELVTANSIMDITYKIVDLLFNGISGLLVSLFTIYILYKVNLVLFIMPLLIMKFVKFNYKPSDEIEEFNFKVYKRELIDGFKVLGESAFRMMLVTLVIINLFHSINAVGFPYFARKFDNSELMYGILMSVRAAGSFCGAILVNFVQQKLNPGKFIALGSIIEGVFWIFMCLTDNVILVYIFLFLSYLFFGAINIMYASMFQALIPREFLGRASATLDSIITLAMPIGSIIGGVLVSNIHINNTMILYGICLTVIGVYYCFNKNIYGIPKLENL